MRRFLVVTFVALAAALLLAAVPLPPKPERYVTDRAGILPDDREAALEEKLKAFERTTSTQVIVYLDTNLPEGTTLEELSAAAIREWGVGQKEKDNGIIVFLFTGSRDIRIEVGYGLEGALPDARAKRIISDVMTPRLRASDYPEAIDQGVQAIFSAVRHEPYRGTGRTVAEVDTSMSLEELLQWVMPLLIIGMIVVVVIKGINDAATGKAASGITFGPGGSSSSSSRHWSSSSSSSSTSSSSSSGGFRGGGGSGGGGGASGKW